MWELLAFLFFAAFALVGMHTLVPVFHTAIPGGLEDTRLFLWNAWWFRYALHDLHTNPYFTRLLFHPFGTSLIAHDFPLWNNLVTTLAQSGGLNLIAACNVWFLLSWALAGFCTYKLVEELAGKRAPAVVAGLYVMTQSYTLARGMQNWGQFNLWGIALFLWLLVRAHRTERTRDYVIGGLALAGTAACHYYFLIYSGVVWLATAVARLSPWDWHVSRRVVAIERPQPHRGELIKRPVGGRPPELRRFDSALKGRIFFLAVADLAGAIAAWILLRHPQAVVVGSVRIGLESPANALLVMWLGFLGWYLMRFQIQRMPNPRRANVLRRAWLSENLDRANDMRAWRNEALLLATALVCLSPLILAALGAVRQGDYPRQGILWKTHMPGANLLSLVMPNPLQVFWGPAISRWYVSLGLNPQEQAASIGWVCLMIVCWSGLWRSSNAKLEIPQEKAEPSNPWLQGNWVLAARHWLAVAVAATILSMGTYLHVLALNTWMPLPFYLWRLIPVLGNVRVPERWMALGAIAWGVVLALALITLARKKNWNLRWLCMLVGAAVLVENWPGIPLGAPPADQPAFETLRQLPRGGVLPLPLYIGDSSIGAGSAEGIQVWDTLGEQIYHHQPLLGGYIGRISRRLIHNYKADPFMNDLLIQEEGADVVHTGLMLHGAALRRQACAAMKQFDVSYVLITPQMISPSALAYAKKAIPLQPIITGTRQTTGEADGSTELYRVSCPK